VTIPSKEIAVRICNELGIHARAAVKFINLANKYASEIYIRRPGGDDINGKSIMGVMYLEAHRGDQLIISAFGSDCEEAALALAKLVQDGFNEWK
jgi:phosphocarrier protein